MPCSHCQAPIVIARGLCNACYQRARTNGTVARKTNRNIGPCSEPECNEPAVVKGLCYLHYSRRKHPLNNTWNLIKSRYQDQVPLHWQDFDAFLLDVGERPTSRHQLRRVDETKAYSKSNVRWLEPVRAKDCYTKEERAEYVHAWSLRKKFGISKADYDKMQADQGDVCAICHNQQCSTKGALNQIQRLCVDHDHSTQAVRGLLCVRCNRMLGYARDDIEVLKLAIGYLKKHGKK